MTENLPDIQTDENSPPNASNLVSAPVYGMLLTVIGSAAIAAGLWLGPIITSYLWSLADYAARDGRRGAAFGLALLGLVAQFLPFVFLGVVIYMLQRIRPDSELRTPNWPAYMIIASDIVLVPVYGSYFLPIWGTQYGWRGLAESPWLIAIFLIGTIGPVVTVIVWVKLEFMKLDRAEKSRASSTTPKESKPTTT
jgi:uncharacterized membrane protein